MSETGGHLGSSLGVVELTVAIHAVFNTPFDKLVWDVGHQCYPHKVLTGRRDRIRTLRQEGGLSGFTKRSEYEYDPFGAAHSSTSISAALGFAVGRDMGQATGDAIAVIGDGSIRAGMAYEAMNNAGTEGRRLFVILNDNEMSIAPAGGRHVEVPLRALYGFALREDGRRVRIGAARPAPRPRPPGAGAGDRAAAGGQGTLFEELGFTYVGPIDGHDMGQLLPVLRAARARATGPDADPCADTEGQGLRPCRKLGRQVSRRGEVRRGVRPAGQGQIERARLYQGLRRDTDRRGGARSRGSSRSRRRCRREPASTSCAKRFPARVFDVGIAEQHGVTFAAGMAASGLKPFCAIYSTFLQRGYDQVVHDVALQGLPVRFAIDRAGLVGADGRDPCGGVRRGAISRTCPASS